MPFTLTLWTNRPETARNADRAGVDRIGLDLETLGKASRQRGLPTWISPHDIAQLPAIRDAIGRARLFVRCNPLHAGSVDEVARLLDLGVEILMLPNFEDIGTVALFVDIVAGRAEVVPLVERRKAARDVARFASLPEIAEIHIGLNDLSIDYGVANRLALLASDELAEVAAAALGIGLRLSVGGIGRANDASLPVPSDVVYAQYPRLGATGALIARSFRPDELGAATFAREIRRLRERLAWWGTAGAGLLDAARRDFRSAVAAADAMAR